MVDFLTIYDKTMVLSYHLSTEELCRVVDIPWYTVQQYKWSKLKDITNTPVLGKVLSWTLRKTTSIYFNMETYECQLGQSEDITSKYQDKPTRHTQYKSGDTSSTICIKASKSDYAQVPEWLRD